MTTQYNVVTYGNLTNNNGVLSGFSASNYATLPLNFNPTLLYYDIVFKFNTANVSQEQVLFMVYNANNYTFPVVNIEIFNSALYFETTSGEVQYAEIIGITTLSSNTDYWVKVNRNGNTYTLYLSTDGTTFVSEGTYTTNSHPPLDNYKSLIGLYYSSIDGFKLPFDGGIDLNESYINIDNIRWWQGVTVTSNVRTRIQLRHDTAANWTSVNPVLLDGEVGIETDTRKQKIGDGSTAWNSLPYDVGSTALQSITSSNVTTALGYTPVNKAGDTMSGNLTISKSNPNFIVKDSRIDFTTNPSSNIFSVFSALKDANNVSVGEVWHEYRTDGSHAIFFQSRKSATDNNTYSTLKLGWDGSGNRYAELNSKLLVGGILTVNGNATQQIIKNNIDYSTRTTAGEVYSDLQFQNYEGTRFNTIRSAITYDNTGTANGSYMIFGSNKLNNSFPDGIKLFCDSNNNLSCTFPKTTCCDGQWVNTSVQLANNVSLPIGADQEITYDLSSAIPNNNYKYEVVLNYGVQTGNSSGAGLSANIIGSGDSIWHRICDTYARGSWYMVVGGNIVVTVGTTRTIKLHYTTISKAGQLNYLYVEGYRRIGTNA
ncbi:MAG: hypothetical protein II393_00505 [Cytophagales bacterium]|nr:hypothetical protein [Cytophagales bacterium]MBQ5918962.1 hypothetical protein [Lachnospiraceae bacterium]